MLVWVDLEMTGLNPDTDVILEIAVVLTDDTPALKQIIHPTTNERAELHLIIQHPPHVLDRMNEWCKDHHGASGLTQRVLDSKIQPVEAQEKILEFLEPFLHEKPFMLAGNSVHVDKQFLQRGMPAFHDLLHYRIVDVSTVKELCRRWYPKAAARVPQKKMSHRALDDIVESLNELRYYQQTIFRP